MGSGSLMTVISLAFLALLVLWIWRIFVPAKGRPMVCTTCGHHGPTRRETRGSIWLEVVLWLLLIVPGLVYSVWRMTTRRQVCAACGATTLVPADTPTGRRMLQADKG